MQEALDDLKQIKKDYGEGMMHLCRSLFPTLLETPGLLYKVISGHCAKSKDLYTDIISGHKEYSFKEYIYSFVDVQMEEEINEEKSVRELLDEAGYKLFECKTNGDIQRFRKYYTEKEVLCTFKDPYRIDDHYIFFIVKKDVDKIKREDFKNPEREDEYGVSVLDLQFDKGARQRISIKSRYNHTVANPDATYSNNLDAIIPGLTKAFERDYEFNIGGEYKTGFELKDYVEARDGKLYKYNYEINNIHYCTNNIIIDNGYVIDKYSKEPERYLFMDYFILDLKEKKMFLYDEKEMIDSFIDGLQDIKDIKVTNKEGYKEVRLTLEEDKEAIINLDKRGRIIEYTNNYLKRCGDDFLAYNKTLTSLNLPNLEECGNNFLSINESLTTLNLPKLELCGICFLWNIKSLLSLNLPSLKECGHYFLYFCKDLQSVSLPKLERCGNYFLHCDETLTNLSLPSLKECEDGFLGFNQNLVNLNLPNLKKCGYNFLCYNRALEILSLPKLEECGDNFLCANQKLISLSLPSLEEKYYSRLPKNLVVLLPDIQDKLKI